MDCSLAIEEYILYKEAIKNRLKILEPECPKEVLKYLLKPESISRIKKVINCEYTDSFDKKLFIEYSKMISCSSFKNII